MSKGLDGDGDDLTNQRKFRLFDVLVVMLLTCTTQAVCHDGATEEHRIVYMRLSGKG